MSGILPRFNLNPLLAPIPSLPLFRSVQLDVADLRTGVVPWPEPIRVEQCSRPHRAVRRCDAIAKFWCGCADDATQLCH